MRRFFRSGGWLGLNETTSICDVICRFSSAPQSQRSLLDSPQRRMFAPNLLTPVRSLFSRVQARRGRPTPCRLFVGVGMLLWSLVVMYVHDSSHLVCINCFDVSYEGTEDTSIVCERETSFSPLSVRDIFHGIMYSIIMLCCVQHIFAYFCWVYNLSCFRFSDGFHSTEYIAPY